jgi:division protein CdvB (Snf7/Vps24/ESCRT-III family)
MWKIKEENKEASALKIKTDLEALKSEIKEIADIEVGIDINEIEANYDVILVSTFKTQADLDAYQVHPMHKAVAVFIKSVATSRVAVDYLV